MPVNSKILDLLVCPHCLGNLIYQQANPKRKGNEEGLDELWCRVDKMAFPIRKEIPVMLIEETRPLSLEELDGCK